MLVVAHSAHAAWLFLAAFVSLVVRDYRFADTALDLFHDGHY
jgi:hypothetical protein